MADPRNDHQRLQRIKKGDPLTAVGLFNPMIREINLLVEEFRGPRQVDPPAEDGQAAEIWNEVERVVEVVRISDPDDSSVFVDVERISTVTMQRPDGELVQLVFTNPEVPAT